MTQLAEALLQLHLLVGLPRTINALGTVHQLGVCCDDDSWQNEPSETAVSRSAAGEGALRRIYGNAKIYII
jgi:hypothetical protein